MNCDEVTAILDGEQVDGLDPVRRRDAEAHVAVCADCARAWHVQRGLGELPDLALPADFRMRCRALVAAGSQPAARRRAGSRVLLVGAAVAAAATTLTVLLRPAAPVAPDPVVQIVQADSVPATVEAASEEPAAGLLPAILVETPPELQFTVRLIPYKAPTEERIAEAIGSEGEGSAGLAAIGLAAVQANTSDPARVQALQSLYAALVDELRAIPGLALLESDPTELTSSSRHYRLTIGFMTIFGADGRMLPIDSRYVAVSLGTEQLQSGGKSVRRSSPNSRIDLQATCSGPAPAADPPCNDVWGVAASMVQTLRREVFPPEASVTRALRARFRDSSLDPTERFKALAELFTLQSRTGETGLLQDAGVVRAAIDLAGIVDPTHRAQLWRSLRGVGSADLVDPMLSSLIQDPEDVRLAAIETLAADFRTDLRVQLALETVALNDPRPLVRAVARRALSGEEGWRQYVTASLKDPNRPAAERVEALVYYLYPPGPTRASTSTIPDYFQVMQELLDDVAVRALAEAIPESGGLGSGGNNLLGNFSSLFKDNPAVPVMLLRVLEHDTKPLMRAVAGQNLARFNAGEPRVREALTRALASDPDARVRDAIRSVLGNKAP